MLYEFLNTLFVLECQMALLNASNILFEIKTRLSKVIFTNIFNNPLENLLT